MSSKRAPSKQKKSSKNRSLPSARPEALPGRTARAGTILPWLGFSVVLIACFAWVLGHAFLVDTVTVKLCDKMDAGIPKNERLPVFLNEVANDGYVWNRHAEALGKDGRWRVRHTDFDNAPDGREVHWNSAFAWYLRGLGEIRRAVTGESLRNSIFRMSIWANPILLLLSIGIFSTLSARRFGPLCGTVIAIGMVAVPTFYEGFMPAYPDHHGLISFALLGMIFGIAWAGAGWVQEEKGGDFVLPHSLKQAEHGMIFSAVCGAMGLWISAISTAVVLGTIGLSALVTAWIFGRGSSKKNALSFAGALWKKWALWGAGLCLFFYLLEYFPSDMGMRLEVNHPLYAIAWLGGGWSISVLAEWICASGKNPFPWRRMVWPVLAGAALPVAILVGGDSVYSAKDPFLMRLYQYLMELLPLVVRIQIGTLTWGLAFGWYPVFLVAGVVLMGFRRVGTGTKAILMFLSIPILVITALVFYQTRWSLLAGPLYIALAGIVIPQAWKLVPSLLWKRTVAAGLLIGLACLFIEPSFENSLLPVWEQFRSGDKISCSRGQTIALLHRQMAKAILDNARGRPVTLLSSPNSSCLLSALGGFRTIGTLYWENAEGLKAAAEGLNAQNNEEALAFLKKHGVTHVSLMSWENFIEPFFHILYPQPVPGKSFENSFAKQALVDKRIPVWSRPLIFPPNSLTKVLDQQVLLLQVVPEQGATEAKFHLARFARFVEGNPIQTEISLKEILESAPDSNLVNIELADLYISQRRYTEAIPQILRALETVPPEAGQTLVDNMISALSRAEQWDLLAGFLRKAASLSNASPATLEKTAWFFATAPDPSARDPRFALACCERLDAASPDRAFRFLARAAALASSGDFEQAGTLLEKATALNPADEHMKDIANSLRPAFAAHELPAWPTLSPGPAQ